MKKIPVFTLAVASFLITTILAQSGQDNKQTAGQSTGTGARETTVVDVQMKVLTQKLGLTTDQQIKIRPIMQELYDATEQIKQDKSLTRDEQLAKVRPKRHEADAKLRPLLTEDQSRRFDEYLKGPHREMHDGLSGNTSAAAEPAK